MTTILVWVLVTVGGYNTNTITYSPPMSDLESCQRLQIAAKTLVQYYFTNQCVQISIVK